MRPFLLICLLALLPTLVQAQSFTEALSLAYHNNPQLAAAQAQLRATDTQLSEAQSGWRPTVTATGEAGIGRTWVNGKNIDSDPKDIGASVIQPIFRGGRTVAATGIARNNIFAQRASLVGTEQSLLLNSAAAYLDVLRDQAVLELNRNNASVLNQQLGASRNRFEVGEITRTDVSQSESRLSGAQASAIQAEGLLNNSRATFTRLIGQAPGTLESPDINYSLPATLEETLAKADLDNPQVIAANYAERAARRAIDLNRGELLPEFNVVGSASRNWDGTGGVGTTSTVTSGGRIDDARVVGQLTVPLYQAGGDYARLSGARQTATQRRLELDNARQGAREAAVSAWSDLNATRATLDARDAQIKAAQLAANGVRDESTVGTRTTLDVLDAEQELLNANVQRVQAERDYKLAILQVLAATGQLTAPNLKLAGPYYDPDQHYKETDGNWLGD